MRGLSNRIESVRLMPWRLKTRVPQILESKRIFDKIALGSTEWLTDIS